MENQLAERIESHFEAKTSVISRDLKLNLLRFVNESTLEPIERALAGLAVAQATQQAALGSAFEAALQQGGLNPDEIQEARESAAIMAMLNTYYRFRHMVSHGPNAAASEDYKSAGLRMTALARPVLGKKRFEMLAFAVSVINGCETCIQSHEKVLREAGLTAEQVHDLARLAAIMRGIQSLN